MPTGYTAAVQEGKVTSFREFALTCARGMGALITMRDDPADAEIPDEFEPSSYYVTALMNAQQRLAELETYDLDRAEAEAAAEYAKRLKQEREREERREAEKARYEAMLAKVRAWNPPTKDHVGMKDFMIEQLTESIRFDCSPGSWPEPVQSSPQEWLAAQRETVTTQIVRYTEQLAAERQRAADRTAWVQALKASLAQIQED